MAGAVVDEDGLPTPQRYWSMFAIGLAITMAVLDSAIANVALPTIAREFNVAPPDAIWIVNAYQLAIVVSLLPVAALGEIVGYARVYKVGLALFSLASLACVLSDSLLTLTLARVFQGFGAAGIMAINAALVRFTYPHRLLGRGIGLNALIVSVASALGPTIARRFDVASAALNALAFGCIISGVDLVSRSENKSVGLALLAVGGVSAVLLARRELKQAIPLLPLDLLRIPIFALSIATSVCSFCAQMLAFVSLPFYLEGFMHRSAVETGVLLTPWPIAVGIVAPISGHLADRFSAAILGGIGLVMLAAGLFALALLAPNASDLDIAWRMTLCGLGFGFFQAPNNRTMIAAAPRNRAGAAGGMLATARLTGQTAGATMVAIFLAAWPDGGEHLSLIVGGCLAIGGALASTARLRTAGSGPAA